MAGINEVIMRLLAETREYNAKLDESIKKNVEFSKSTVPMGQQIKNFANTATTAMAGLGLALGAYGVDQALKFEQSLDTLRNQSGASAKEIEYLKGKILDISSTTGIASTSITNAFLSVEKAGIRGANATNLVTAASKAAVATGGDVVQMTQAIIAAQTIQSAKGMSVAQVADLMVIANRHHIGSLDNLVQVLQGKVGGTLAAYGVSLAQSAAISDVASQAGYSNARAMVALANGIGKVENPTKATTKQLASMGINANKLAQDARTSGGIITVLKDLETQSRKTGIPMDSLIRSVFGQGAGLATVLDKNLPKLVKLTDAMSKASGKDLNTVFGISQGQLDNQLKILKTNFQNAMTGLGLLLLPTVKQVAGWAAGAVKYFQEHPLVAKIASDATITLFALAIGKKIFDVVSPIFKLIPKFGDLVWADVLPMLGLGAEAYAVNKKVLQPTPGAISTANNPLAWGTVPNAPTVPTADQTSAFKFGAIQPSTKMQNFAFITQSQQTALLQWASANKISQFSKTFEKAAYNFANQDAKGNYSVKVTVK